MRTLTTLSATLILAGPTWADPAQVDQLISALRVPQIVSVMAQEGRMAAEDLEETMLQAPPTPDWAQDLDAIYAPEAMLATVSAQLKMRLNEHDITPMLRFAQSDLGRRALALELSAREAILDPDVETAAMDSAAALFDAQVPRAAQITTFIEVNDLVDRNVAGALNSNLAFYQGLSESGGLAQEMTESDMLRAVWEGEEDVRIDTGLWVEAYLLMAYGPLSDADLDGYIAFSRAPEGQDLLEASFGAYDTLFDQISHALGLAVGRQLSGQSL